MTGDNFHQEEIIMEVPENSSVCPPEGTFPTPSQLKLGLGPAGSSALLACVILVLITNAVMFFILLAKFLKNIPQSQVWSFIWKKTKWSIKAADNIKH